MQSFFAIIIGAGPGGLTAARILAEQGHKVLVLERNSTIGPKVCGGGITSHGLIGRVPPKIIDRSFATQHIHSSRQAVKIQAASPIVSTVSRERLGQWMLKQAVEAGATIKAQAPVREINGQQVTTTDQRFAYRYLIGADGSTSLVRKYLRLPTRRMGVGIHYLVPGDFTQMEWHLNSRFFGNGYAWIFPFQGWASVGVYGNNKTISPRSLLRRLHQWAAERGLGLKGLKPKAGVINYDYQGWRFGNKMLIGDAAGLASGLTGEGIFPALVSGETAARTIMDDHFIPTALNNLIAKQRKHRKIVELSGINPTACSLTMELLILALRTGIINFNMLEMAD